MESMEVARWFAVCWERELKKKKKKKKYEKETR